MAATIATAIGIDKSGRAKLETRLGSESATGKAATWHTFASVTVWADGSGIVEVKRDGETLHRFAFGSENVNGSPE